MCEVLALQAEPRKRGFDGHLRDPGDLADLRALFSQEDDEALPGRGQQELVQQIASLDGPVGREGACSSAMW